MKLQPPTLDEIRDRHAAATPGPWRWAGNLDAHHMELTTVDRGMLYVMRFVRWGTQSAQPMFQPLPIGAHTAMVKATEVPIFEVAPDAVSRDDPRVYRGDLVGLRHPDADFIAHARSDVPHLLELVERYEGALKAIKSSDDSDLSTYARFAERTASEALDPHAAEPLLAL